MEEISFTDRGLSIKSWVGLPSSIVALFFALVHSDKGWWVYIGILILGWYLYTLFYWKLYQRYMLNKLFKQETKFYSLLVGYQLALLGALVAYAL